VVARFAQFSATILLLGTSLFLIEFGREKAAIPEIRRALRHWQRPVLASAAAIALASSVAWLDIEAGLMSGHWSNTANPKTLSTVLLQTKFGHVWTGALASAAVLLLVLSAPEGRQTTIWTILVAGLAAFLLASSSWTGHAVMHSGPAGALHPTVQVIHVLAASAWLGSLPPLGFALRKAWTMGQAVWRDAARYILPRYSRMGYVAVGLILLTGLLNSWLMVDSIDALFSTTYGRILVAKILLFLLMVSVAAVNRFVLTPQVIRPTSCTLRPELAFQRLWRNVAAEQVLGLAIIAIVSVLGTVAPAMSGHTEM
jgi:putative copper resistance protein D